MKRKNGKAINWLDDSFAWIEYRIRNDLLGEKKGPSKWIIKGCWKAQWYKEPAILV